MYISVQLNTYNVSKQEDLKGEDYRAQ